MNPCLKNILDTAIAYITTEEGTWDDLETAVLDYLVAVKEERCIAYDSPESTDGHTADNQPPTGEG